jgi:hypothetical protein
VNNQRIHHILGVTFLVLIIQFLFVTAYSWPASDSGPRNLPVAITGPSAAVVQVTGKISDADPGAFTFITAPSPTAARDDITSRLTYGAIIVGPGGDQPRVLVASGAGPAVASVLTDVGLRLAGQPTTPRDVTDIVPASKPDSSGAFGFTVLMVMLTSLIAGAILTTRVRRQDHRLLAVVVFSIAGGLIVSGVAHTWLGTLPGNYLVIASVVGLGELAIVAGVSGLAQLGRRFGKPLYGIALGYGLFMLIGNPFSGINSAPQMLPGSWGTIGQSLPTGAVGTLLRSVAYFDGARSAGPWAVLGVWAGIGLLLLAGVRPRTVGAHTGGEVLSTEVTPMAPETNHNHVASTPSEMASWKAP